MFQDETQRTGGLPLFFCAYYFYKNSLTFDLPVECGELTNRMGLFKIDAVCTTSYTDSLALAFTRSEAIAIKSSPLTVGIFSAKYFEHFPPQIV